MLYAQNCDDIENRRPANLASNSGCELKALRRSVGDQIYHQALSPVPLSTLQGTDAGSPARAHCLKRDCQATTESVCELRLRLKHHQGTAARLCTVCDPQGGIVVRSHYNKQQHGQPCHHCTTAAHCTKMKTPKVRTSRRFWC
mmetsp:Transcript_10671/g.21359  ORF Transcript_10671/g.21359 Transcript_10671/m.21359 type:complete len:143 (-) Transcript_10671:96-524(-)